MADKAAEQAKPNDKTPAISGPDIFEFMDYRQFLSARLGYLQTLDKKYSQRWVAKKAGIKSPQLLSMIINGQRHLNRELALPIANAMKMSNREVDYFRLIVDLASSESEVSRQELFKKINALVREEVFTSITPDTAIIFKEWYYPALREIVILSGFHSDPAWIAERLGITKSDVELGISDLLKAGFLKEHDGTLIRSEPSIRTAPNKVFPMYLSSFHLKILDAAFRGLRHTKDKRHYEALTVAVPRSLVPRLKSEIQKFFREIDALCEGEDQREEVIQIQLSMFPLTNWDTGGKSK